MGDTTMQGQLKLSQEIQSCIENSNACHAVCTITVNDCLQKGGAHSDAVHIRLLLDCAEICQTNTNFMLRSSDFNMQVCNTCAMICDACAENCEKITNDIQMKSCAESCRKCAQSCRKMSAQRAA